MAELACQFCGELVSSPTALREHARTCSKNPRNIPGKRENREGDGRKKPKK